MIGRAIVRQIQQPKFEPVLNYCAVSAPLSLGQIIDDIREWKTTATEGRTPEKIVLWEHQRDWLKKQHDKNYGRTAAAFQVPTMVVPGESVTVDTIMGIPVELLS